MKFEDALKSVFYEISHAAINNAARVPLLDASGNPIGSDTFANVASRFGNFFYGSCTTGGTTAAKTATITGFVLSVNACVAIRFTNAIQVSSPTLNINSTGAKPIYYNGAALTPNVVRGSNTVIFQYDGTRYNIISIDGSQSSGSDTDLYVDMGLPSGILWAKSNIDLTQSNGFAASPYQYECSFFSWGNTDGHNPTSTSSFAPYDWGGVNSQEPFYEGQPYGDTEGNKLTTHISPSYDAARVNLGSPWRMPTNTEYAELFSNIDYLNADGTVKDASVTNKLSTVNGIVGIWIQSKINGARLFFSCSGSGGGTSRSSRGSRGYYWSSTWFSARSARSLIFSSGGVYPQYNSSRYFGFALRPVI